MTQSQFFECLGAPLKNVRWSWGGQRKNGDLVLRVWKDRIREREGISFAMLTHHSKYENNQSNLGYRERVRHVAALRRGERCYLVICQVEDAEAAPRSVRVFDRDNICIGGRLLEWEGDTWIEIVGSVPAASLFVR